MPFQLKKTGGFITKSSFYRMDLSEEQKARIYFEVLLSEKTRLENEIRWRENIQLILIAAAVSALGVLIVMLNFLRWEMAFTLLGMVSGGGLIVVLYLMHRDNIKEKNNIKNLYNRYIYALDKMAQPSFDFFQNRREYIKLRKLELDIKEGKEIINIVEEVKAHIRELYREEFQ